MDEIRRKSTILGDKEIFEWGKEKEALRKARERKHKAIIVDRIPEDVKSKPFSGVEKEQLLKGMSLLEIFKRRMKK